MQDRNMETLLSTAVSWTNNLQNKDGLSKFNNYDWIAWEYLEDIETSTTTCYLLPATCYLPLTQHSAGKLHKQHTRWYSACCDGNRR
ncbi:hypothetical protein EYF80_035740 [Liparis tanakae]|uniref:Uncharacterized protein n=1 Tax=Liparis tanakae TaxID=230148 RepID=A0A4Z2GL45_9TELE|nr:hypothetical protein EYF80_035740 [Liparis tanakae]